MTKAELFDVWKRWMHRNDVDADLNTVWQYAVELVDQSLFSYDKQDPETMLAEYTRPHTHAGLIYLWELAQNDEGLAREMRLFTTALQDYAIAKSARNVSPRMKYAGGIV